MIRGIRTVMIDGTSGQIAKEMDRQAAGAVDIVGAAANSSRESLAIRAPASIWRDD